MNPKTTFPPQRAGATKTAIVLAMTAVAMGLAACGGGGGTYVPGTGFVTPTKPKISASLTTTSGKPVTDQQINGTDSYIYTITLNTAQGKPVSNTLVAFTVSEGITMTPATGQQITDANGKASITIQRTDPFASGAAKITASASVPIPASGTTAATEEQAEIVTAIGFAGSQPSFTPGSPLGSIAAYGSTQVSALVKTATGEPLSFFPVSFSATCGTVTPANAITDSNGNAVAMYNSTKADGGTCVGDVRIQISANGVNSPVGQVTVLPVSAANIQFASSTPSRIYIANGVNQATMTFKVLDPSGKPVPSTPMRIEFVRKPAGTTLNNGGDSAVMTTDASGQAIVTVNAGTAPGPVQLQASLVSNANVKTFSNNLAIGSGLPAQSRMTMSIKDSYNVEGWRIDQPFTVTMTLADRLGNPVPDGTTVNFISNGGTVPVACQTAGAESGISQCSVTGLTSNPRLKGRVVVMAWAQGEKDFTDMGPQTNNVYDFGEPFFDQGQPFLDANENGTYDQGEQTVGTGFTGTAPCGSDNLSVPNTCTGAWGGTLVRRSFVMTYSDSFAVVTTTPVQSTSDMTCSVNFNVKDLNNNPMPAGTSITVAGVSGGGVDEKDATKKTDAAFDYFGGMGDKVPNTVAVGGTNHVANFKNCNDPGSIRFRIEVKSPSGQGTIKAYP